MNIIWPRDAFIESQKVIWGEVCPCNMSMVNGMADRLGIINTTGNGQVPIVAATAWRILSGE